MILVAMLCNVQTKIKDLDEPKKKQGAVNKMRCSGCIASYIGETDKILNKTDYT